MHHVELNRCNELFHLTSIPHLECMYLAIYKGGVAFKLKYYIRLSHLNSTLPCMTDNAFHGGCMYYWNSQR